MLVKEMLLKTKLLSKLFEGGNVAIRGKEAEHINLLVTKRSFIVPILNKLLYSINQAFAKQYKTAIWSPNLLQNQSFLSGSSLHFFNVKGIPDDVFVAKKPKVGDIDTMVNRDLEPYLAEFLNNMEDKQIGPATLIGYQRGNEQFSSLWELQNPPMKIQIDFEFVEFDQDEPTEWAKFSHSSSWEDLAVGVKGVFHKFLIQSLASLTRQEFLLRKMVGRGKAKQEQDIPTVDNMVSFAVSSKEGGGLRAKYTPVIDPKTNKPLVKDGMYVMTAAPAAGYEQSVSNIFAKLFGKKLNPKAIKTVAVKFWSFTGLLELMSNLLDNDEKQQVANSFLEKTLGAGAQGLYKNDPNRDLEEKSIAINKMYEILGIKPPVELNQMKQAYKNAYKMTATESINEADGEGTPDYRRVGIKHISNPGSSTEMKDMEFIELCREIAANNGKLDGMPINLKVDGAGIRFGKDQSGRPFFLTSRITTPMYAENIGDFTKYGVSKGQSPEQLERTKQYDYALDAIVNGDFIDVLPADTIVQAEMLFNGMAEKTPEGLKFVNISYDPKKLGRVMTLVPFSVKTYSTGQTSPEENQIKKELVAQSNNQVKIIDNQLIQRGVDVSKIIAPVLSMGPDLLATLQLRTKDTPEKQQARAILAKARQELSDFIINNPKIKGKDQLGSNIEGLVLNMPSGRLAKITSSLMKEKMAAKKAPAPKREGPAKTAVVAVGSAIGHIGHQQLFNYAIEKAKEVGGDPYMFIGPAEGVDDPIPPSVKVQTWKKLYPQYANNISTIAHEGGTLLQKIKHELISPTPGKPPRYDNIIITVGTDRATMASNWSGALMKAVNKFPGYEHVKVIPYVTGRGSTEGGTGVSGTMLRNVLKDPNKTPEQQFQVWNDAYNSGNFGAQKLPPEWIKHLMDIARQNMGLQKTDKKAVVKEFIQRVRPMLKEASAEQKIKVLKLLKESLKVVAEDFSDDMSTEDMIAYLKQHHDKNLHPDYINHLTSTNSKFVLKNIPLNSIKTELSGLDREKVEQYKQMDFSKAPPIVVGSDGNILDGYHRANVAKALGIPTIKAYIGVKGKQGMTEGLNEFAANDGDDRDDGPGFLPWNEFIGDLKAILGDQFDVVENVVKTTIKAKFSPHDPMEFGPTMLYSYYERRPGHPKGAISNRGAIQVGKYIPNTSGLGKQNFISSFDILKGHPFERHFDLTGENVQKIADIIMGNTKGAYQMQSQGVAEAAGLYGPFTVTINTGERPQSRTKTKKFRREDDAILWAEDWLEDAPQYVFATAQVTDPDGNVVWTTDESLEEQGVAEEYNGNVKDTQLKNVDPKNHSQGEGDFVKNQLHTMKRVITHLDNAIGCSEDVPDWVQSEIAQAADKIVGVMDYTISSKEQDIEKHSGYNTLMKEEDVVEAEEPFNLAKQHPMNYSVRSLMIRRIARATGYEISALSLASDEELTKLYYDKVKSKQELDEYNIRKTKKFIKKAHDVEQGQKYGDMPYSSHPKAVAEIGKRFFGSKFNTDAYKVALLHDILEDTPYTAEQLARKGFSKEVIEAVQLLTKNKALSYADNIKNIINSGNPLAMMVKYCDNYMNFSSDKSHWDPKRAAHSQKKYLASLNMLGDVLGIKHHIGKTEQEVDETIRKVGSQYRLVSKKGKNLGTYPTKTGAEKREKQVNYFKHTTEDVDYCDACDRVKSDCICNEDYLEE